MRMSERIESLHKILVGEANKYADLYIKFLRLKEQRAELLEALRDIAEYVDDCSDAESDEYIFRIGYTARKAIAKATDGG